MYFLNVNRQYADFAKGLIDISNVTFFIGGIALFLVLATKTLESRKWR
jgi:GTP cyclohydrolase III